MDATLILVGGALVMGIMQLAKKLGIDQKRATVGLAAILGLGYFIYNNYVDPVIQEQIMTDVVAIIGTAKLMYDFITATISKENALPQD